MSNSTVQTTSESVPEFPMSRDPRCPFDPPPELRELARSAPLQRVRIWDGSTPWIVTGLAEQRALLSDERVSVNDKLPGFPHWHAGMAAHSATRPRSFFNSDPPEHTRIRRVMTGHFQFKRIAALRPAIQKITEVLVDEMVAGPAPADLVQALGLPLPTLMICELLGVPYSDRDFFQKHSRVRRNATAEEQIKNSRAVFDYMIHAIEARRDNPTDDVIGDLATRVVDAEVSLAEAAQVAQGLLIAGHETSANMIGLGTLALLENPDQAEVFRAGTDPKAVANGVEELLRYLSVIHNGQRRIAKEDIEIGGVTVRAGEGLIIELASANWDERAFPAPEQLDLGRAGVSRHHAFGFGIHQCVGQQLARAELQIVFSTLFQRVPTLRLATTVDQIEFKHDRLAYGVYALPVAW